MFRRYVLAVMLMAVPALGYSVDVANWYMRGLAGYNHVSIARTPEARLKAGEGFVVGGAVGYRFSRCFRFEGELSYRRNNLDRLIVRGDLGKLTLAADGHLSSFAYMGNAFFDLPLSCIVSPYVGVGLGGLRERGEGSLPLLATSPSAIDFRHRNSDVAYQAIVGLSLLHCPKLDCGLEYHFLDTLSDFDSTHNHSLALTCWKVF